MQLEWCKKKTSKLVVLGFFVTVASFCAHPAPRRRVPTPLMLALGTSLESVEWNKADLGGGHAMFFRHNTNRASCSVALPDFSGTTQTALLFCLIF